MTCCSLILAAVISSGPTAAPTTDVWSVPSEKLVASAPLSFVFSPTALQDPVLESQPDAADSLAVEIEPLIAPYGTSGSSRWFLQFGRGGGVHKNERTNSLSLVGVGYSYFLGRGISIDFELNGTAHNQAGEDAVGVNVNILFRWHFHMERDFSLFLDAGAGAQQTNEDVPRLASKFNWTPQAGAGIAVDVGRDMQLLLAVRWRHQSNANIFEKNPGRDSILGIFQLNFPF